MMAPGEKSEHLIYVILPISIAFYFLVQWEISTLSLALASIFSSFLALFLFELSIDELVVKAVFRRLSGKKYGFQRRRFLLWNFFLQSWNYEHSSFDAKYEKLEREISQMSEAAVSSSLVSPRLWRLRGEIYLIVSVIPLVSTLTIILNDLVSSSFMSASPWFTIIQQLAGIFNNNGFVIILILMGTLTFVAWYRHRHLSNTIRYLAQFRYMERNLALANMSDESDYDYVGAVPRVWKEITLQIELLKLRDWSFFIDRTSRWGRKLSKQIADDILENGLYSMIESWAYLANPNVKNNRDELWDQMCWTHYYFKKLLEFEKATRFDKSDDEYPKLDELSKKLIEHIGEKIESDRDYFNKPDELLDYLVMTPHDSKPYLPILQTVAFKPNLRPNATLKNVLPELMNTFSKKQSSTYNPKKAALAIIHIFKGGIPKEISIWGTGNSPYTRLSNLLKATGCESDGLDEVVKHCIQQSPKSSLEKMKNDKEIIECITKLGFPDILDKRLRGIDPTLSTPPKDAA